MIDYSHLPFKPLQQTIFYPNSGSNLFQTWTKPKGAKLVIMFGIGGGGGGGGGFTTAGNGGGGGAGASGGVSTAVYPAVLIPDQLYIIVGNGGAGGAANTAGSTATASTIKCKPTPASTTLDVLLTTDSTAAGGGGAGSSVAGGTVGSVGTVTFPTLQHLGLFSNLKTGVSAPGSFNTNAANVTLSRSAVSISGSSGIIGPGGGGGGKTAVIGYSGSGLLPNRLIQQQISGSTVGGAGAFGFNIGSKIIYPVGGMGGAGNPSGVGGRGGDGIYGAGGGGGGAGTTGGAGGRGGNGIVIITTY